LRLDPAYEKISRRLSTRIRMSSRRVCPRVFKLTHATWARAHAIRPGGPGGGAIWQDPVPAVDHKLIDAKDIADLRPRSLASGLSSRAVSTLGPRVKIPRLRQARRGERRGIPSQPQKDWEVNSRPTEKVLRNPRRHSEGVHSTAARQRKCRSPISLSSAVGRHRAAAKKAGHVTVPFAPGRHRRLARANRCGSVAYLEPFADWVPHYSRPSSAYRKELLVDKAQR